MTHTLNKEQKTGISLLLLSKMFERLAFYLIMAILVRYLIESLNIESVTAGIYYSIFYGMIGITTLFAGLLGDLKSRTNVVTVGFILLTFTYLAIAFLPSINILIIVSLIILALGIGLTSPNIVVLLGNIYNEKGNEIYGLPGFVFFSIIVNIVGIIAPPLSIFLKNSLGYNAIFLVAFVFGLISLILFLKFKVIYNGLGVRLERKIDSNRIPTKGLNTIILVSILLIGILIRFALHQRGLTFTFSLRDYLDNSIEFSQTLTSVEKYVSILLLGVFAIFIIRMKQLNWSNILNIILVGIVLCTIAFIAVACFSSLSQLIGEKSVFVKAFILILIAETLISPTIFYAIYRSSPDKYKGLFQGISYIVMAISNQLLFLGVIIYEKSNSSIAFIVFAIVLVISAALILMLKKSVNNKLMEIEKKADNKPH